MPTVSAGSLKAASPSLMLRRYEWGELGYGFYAGHWAATSPGLYDGSGRRRLGDALEEIRDNPDPARAVVLRPDMQVELVKILDALKADGLLSPELAQVREALGDPIVG